MATLEKFYTHLDGPKGGELKQRVELSMAAVCRVFLATGTEKQQRFARDLSSDLGAALGRYIFLVLMASPIRAKVDNLNTITDDELVASFQEIFPGLVP